MSKPSVVWFQAVTCNGNTHSLLCANSNRLELFLNSFELIYHPSLTSDITLDEVLALEKIDYVLIEGAITDNTHFFQISNRSVKSILNELVLKAQFVICVGSCASYGGVHSKFELNPDITGVQESILNKELLRNEVINLTGCPVHPEWILQTMFVLKQQGSIALDEENRPLEIYCHLAHHGCTRNEYFEWKVEAHHFGVKEGCLFYDLGCRGPMTHSNCNRVLWNDVNSKTRAGMPCIGCTEFDFPRENMLETKKNIGIPLEAPVGIPKRAYLSLAGVAKTFKIERLNKKLIEK
jgi:hydrogenase small subunit